MREIRSQPRNAIFIKENHYAKYANPLIREFAKALFDGGWRSTDYDQILSEYDFTNDEVALICDSLYDLETESEHTFEAYEDNAGGLYLVVLIAGVPTYVYENWEYQNPGSLRDAIFELAVDKLAYRSWDGNCVDRINESRRNDPASDLVTAQSLYDAGLGAIVAEITESGGIYCQKQMGTAARLALGIPQEV